MKSLKILGIAAVLALAPASAFAAGNLVAKPTTLEPLKMSGKDLSFSTKEYKVETGKYYKWHVESDGAEEIRLEAPDLWRNASIYQISINNIEVKPLGAIYGVEFDEAGAADIFFVPLQPGNFEFYVSGFKDRGMLGHFSVR